MDGLIAIPLYLQLESILRGKIDSGEYQPGTKLPTEAELSAEYRVSRITVRAALSELVDDGLLEKRRGKGAYVTTSKSKRNIIFNDFSSFSQFCRSHGLEPKRVQLYKKIEKAGELDIAQMGAEDGEDIVCLARVFYADGEVLALSENRLRSQCAFLMDEDLENDSLFRLIKEKFGGSITAPSRSFEVETAAAWEAANLSVPSGSPLLLIRELWADPAGRLFCRTKDHYIANKIRITLTL